MLQRLLITVGVFLAAAAAYWIFARLQRRRASGAGSSSGALGPRVLYFRSDHCTSCETQAELFARLDAETRDVIEMVDVDAEPERAEAYGVLTLPTTLIMDPHGEVQQINYGVTKPDKLKKQLARAGAPA
jgi:thiol-disulfide isomerase/thioredoxin